MLQLTRPEALTTLGKALGIGEAASGLRRNLSKCVIMPVGGKLLSRDLDEIERLVQGRSSGW